MNTVEIMDTTLRDGEQVQNVSYNKDEKLTIAKLLLTEVKVDRLEITSALSSDGEKESVQNIVGWANEHGFINKLEILSFLNKKSIEWTKNVGIKRINLLTKGSYKHCVRQLKKEPLEHFNDIKEIIAYAVDNGIEVNVYLEDFSNGIIDSPDYVFEMVDILAKLPVKRIMLPDTLGIFDPFQTYEYMRKMIDRFPELHFDFHAHNDYGLGTANSLAAVKAGIKGIHLTVNGMGERAGNTAFDEVVVGMKDFYDIPLKIDETKLSKVSRYIEMFSGIRMANNKPIYGGNVFTQTAGIHADGDIKGNLYATKLLPERFGRRREYALGKLAGKASLKMNLQELGIELGPEKEKILLKKIIELGDKKETITTNDLPYLIHDIFDTPQERPFKLINCSINSTYQLKPVVAVKCMLHKNVMEAYGHGDGGFNAFMNALKKILERCDLAMPKLTDYVVTIPPGGNTDALVKATIWWEQLDSSGAIVKSFETSGVNPDQNMAAIEAAIKMVNVIISNKVEHSEEVNED